MVRILIVEDEITLALALEEDLAEMGYEVAGVAFTGEEATIMAGNLLPRLVLMDIMLPGSMDGIVAAEIIQGTLNIPVVFLTGHSKKELIDRAKAIDPYGYVLKPFNEGQVRASIEIALHKKESEARLMEILNKSGPAGSGCLLSSPLPEKFSTLTPKEILVADLVSQGRTTKEIAGLLRMSAETVGRHRGNIRTKLRITNKKVSLMTELLSLSK